MNQAGLDRKNPPASASWPRNPREAFLRAAGIEISFGGEGPVGSRIIRITSLVNIPGGIPSGHGQHP
jgi:hypothetical protein